MNLLRNKYYIVISYKEYLKGGEKQWTMLD